MTGVSSQSALRCRMPLESTVTWSRLGTAASGSRPRSVRSRTFHLVGSTAGLPVVGLTKVNSSRQLGEPQPSTAPVPASGATGGVVVGGTTGGVVSVGGATVDDVAIVSFASKLLLVVARQLDWTCTEIRFSPCLSA